MTETEPEIETSVTTDSESIRDNDWDVEARATDGTYTTLHRVTRVDDTTVAVELAEGYFDGSRIGETVATDEEAE